MSITGESRKYLVKTANKNEIEKRTEKPEEVTQNGTDYSIQDEEPDNMLVSLKPKDGLAFRSDSIEESKYCDDPFFLSCEIADKISAKLLGKESIQLPGNIELKFKNKVPGNENAYNYEGDGSSLIVTYNPASGGLSGTAYTKDGRTFVLENIGKEGHLWKEMDMQKLDALKSGKNGKDFVGPSANNDSTAFDFDSKENTEDNVTMAYISVKVYYTREFASQTNNINEFVDKMLALTNQGFFNSKVPITVVKNCVEAADVNDIYDMNEQLEEFTTLRKSFEDLRDTADTATLLTTKSNYCGLAYTFAFNGNALSVVAKHCVETYTYGHELGHNLGAYHNIENNNPVYPYGHGNRIDPTNGNEGYHTIMSYSANGYRNQVNFYANPAVILPETGTPTGDEKLSNTAAVFLRNRFRMAEVGDESRKCDSGEDTSSGPKDTNSGEVTDSGPKDTNSGEVTDSGPKDTNSGEVTDSGPKDTNSGENTDSGPKDINSGENTDSGPKDTNSGENTDSGTKDTGGRPSKITPTKKWGGAIENGGNSRFRLYPSRFRINPHNFRLNRRSFRFPRYGK
ncbi:uncharacterized protein LOC111716539 isoform X3 [Eurytemora carolleeae]|uniref:uncharacterized protein LOC111716539 isoform X3 n=1 Tax=Eurytemora carolleeae TaxID=1294199 RepID=UPI000C770713|nr:uncharacterized protein LOC111716539 isoform X3 [Eurytemora carolleeae]|eukprot:XP_023347794.1 uncharacterized protein LOC111716539 isoform X3 [Eurytemora affinis]